jgi:outer membrane protein assembly factor BamB
MAERARAIPLATLLCIVLLLVALRVRERGRSAREASSARDGARGGARSAAVTSAALDAAARSIARSMPAEEHDGGASAPHMLHGDARHTNRANAVGPSRANVVWTSRIGAPIEAQVVASLDERTLYVAALDGSLTALDAKDGAKVWSVALGDRVYSTPCVGSNGTIYVGSDAKRFYAVTPQGAIAWKLETAGEADTGAVDVGDAIVFAAGSSVYAVRPGGDVAWRFDAKKKVFTAPAIGEGGMVAFGSQDHHAYALSSAGALRWSTDLGADVDGAPAIADDGAILVGTDGGEVVRLSPAGDVVWRVQVGGFVRGTLSVGRNGDALAGVYGPTPRVVRISPDGAVVGSFGIQGTGAHELGVHGGPLEDARGALFFGAQDDDVYGLGPDEMWEWSYRTGGDVDAPPTLLSSGGLLLGSDDGFVYFFGP